MKINKINTITKLAIATTLFFNHSFSLANLSDDTSKPVKVALLAPLVGSNVSLGNIINLATKIALDEINKTGVRGGKKIQIIQFDTKCDGDIAKQRLDSLQKQNIKYVIGPLCTYTGFFDQMKNYDALSINFASTKSADAFIAGNNQNGSLHHRFLLRNPIEEDDKALVKFTNGRFKNAKVVVFADSLVANSRVANDKIQALKANGHTVNEKVEVVSDIRNINAQIDMIKKANADMIYVSSREVPFAVKFALEIRKAGLNTIIFGDSTLEISDVFDSLKAYSNTIYFASPKNYSNYPDNNTITYEFKKDKKLTIVPSIAYEAHSAITLLARAFDGAKSLQPADVAQYLNKNETITSIGPVKFNNYVKSQFEVITSKWNEDGTITEIK